MIKVLFVCHGNICRSPMAEYVMKDLVRQSGREDEFVIASAATSREELGNPVRRLIQLLERQRLSCLGKDDGWLVRVGRGVNTRMHGS